MTKQLVILYEAILESKLVSIQATMMEDPEVLIQHTELEETRQQLLGTISKKLSAEEISLFLDYETKQQRLFENAKMHVYVHALSEVAEDD